MTIFSVEFPCFVFVSVSERKKLVVRTFGKSQNSPFSEFHLTDPNLQPFQSPFDQNYAMKPWS